MVIELQEQHMRDYQELQYKSDEEHLLIHNQIVSPSIVNYLMALGGHLHCLHLDEGLDEVSKDGGS